MYGTFPIIKYTKESFGTIFFNSINSSKESYKKTEHFIPI